MIELAMYILIALSVACLAVNVYVMVGIRRGSTGAPMPKPKPKSRHNIIGYQPDRYPEMPKYNPPREE